MTKDEALKLALEALEHGFMGPRIIEYQAAITAIKNALAQPEQEPIAYFNPQVKGGFYWANPTKVIAPITVSVEPMPLYTTPPLPVQPVQPVQEEKVAGVAYVDDLDLWHFYPMRETDNFPDGTKFYTAPPKRPWVELTENEIKAIEEKALTKQWAIRMALTAVKEKNT